MDWFFDYTSMSDSVLEVTVQKNEDETQKMKLELKEMKAKIETLECERKLMDQEVNNRKAGTSTGGAKKAPNYQGSHTSDISATQGSVPGPVVTASASSTTAPIVTSSNSTSMNTLQADNSSGLQYNTGTLIMSDSDSDSSDRLQNLNCPVPDSSVPSYDEIMKNR